MTAFYDPTSEMGKLDDVTWAQHLSLTCDRLAWTGGVRQCPKCDGDIPDEFLHWCSYECYCRFLYDHYWPNARARAIRKAKSRCSRPGCRATQNLEVNHLVPFAGARRPTYTCAHHQELLEVLCAPHHTELTTKQQRDKFGIPTLTREQIVSASAEELARTTVCGAMTKSGSRCTRWVDPDRQCWQHGHGMTLSGRLGERM